MIKKKKLIAVLALIFALCTVMLSSCGEDEQTQTIIPEESIVKFDDGSNGGEFYFYGVVKSDKTYYVRVLSEFTEAPSEDQYKYIPLADELTAYFQPDGWVGAWSPNQYLRADELADADDEGKITEGAHFTCTAVDGYADYLEEHNYYVE